MGRAGDPSASAVLRTFLHDQDPFVVRATIRALGKLRAADAAPELLEKYVKNQHLDNADGEYIGLDAAIALGKIGDAQAVQRMMADLKTGLPMAAAGLGAARYRRALRLMLAALPGDDKCRVPDALIWLGDPGALPGPRAEFKRRDTLPSSDYDECLKSLQSAIRESCQFPISNQRSPRNRGKAALMLMERAFEVSWV